MNTKIFSLIEKNLKAAFRLPRLAPYVEHVTGDTVISELPWTPARFRKFCDSIEQELNLDCDFQGTLEQIVDDLDRRYSHRFFGEIWKPHTDDYTFTGWQLAEEINRANPRRVLDVGCGYNQFKSRIPNLIGIDPYNNCADYQIDILDYRVGMAQHDHIIALGSINFNSRSDVEARFKRCVDLLETQGRLWMRVNPGIPHRHGPYVDIFPWSFDIAYEFAEQFGMTLDALKRDQSRLFMVFTKLAISG